MDGRIWDATVFSQHKRKQIEEIFGPAVEQLSAASEQPDQQWAPTKF